MMMLCTERLLCLTLCFLLAFATGDENMWNNWWSYEGISGPLFWGTVNKDWALCSEGQHQSPVDIDPRTLVFDPNLRPLRVDDHRVGGHMVNKGVDIRFYINQTSPRPFYFTGGPLSYKYRVHHIVLHFATTDDKGSEHTVGGKSFPLELQVYGFNIDLFHDFNTALPAAHGIAAIALFAMVSENTNEELEIFLKATSKVPHKDDSTSISDISLVDLLPDTLTYVTYEGSMTQPKCLETVTWIIYNKPLHIRSDQLNVLRSLHKRPFPNEGEDETKKGAQSASRPVLMENNYRPTLPANRRTIRTNLSPESQDVKCGVQKIAFYEVNEKYIHPKDPLTG